MGEHGQDEGLERCPPQRHIPHFSVKRMLRVRERETNEVPTLRRMPSKAFRSQAFGPAFGLESRMQFADVVQERERSKPLAIRLRQFPLCCRRQAGGDDRNAFSRRSRTAATSIEWCASGCCPRSSSVLPQAERLSGGASLLIVGFLGGMCGPSEYLGSQRRDSSGLYEGVPGRWLAECTASKPLETDLFDSSSQSLEFSWTTVRRFDLGRGLVRERCEDQKKGPYFPDPRSVC